jgi:site-specific recombinase XerD
VDVLARYERHQQNKGLLPRSIERIQADLRSFQRSLGGGSLTRASREQAESWLGDRRGRTRYNLISCLHSFYQWAVAEELAESDPTARIVRPKLRQNLPRPIADDDLCLSLKLAYPRMRAWLSLMAFAGLRCQEVAGIRGPDVMLARNPPTLLVAAGKGAKERMVPVAIELEKALLDWGIPKKGPLFRTRTGRPFSPVEVSRQTSLYFESIGVAAVAHMCRHWFGTTVYALTKDPRLVQELMGHATLAQVMVYTKVVPMDSADVVRGLKLNGNGHRSEQQRLL